MYPLVVNLLLHPINYYSKESIIDNPNLQHLRVTYTTYLEDTPRIQTNDQSFEKT